MLLIPQHIEEHKKKLSAHTFIACTILSNHQMPHALLFIISLIIFIETVDTPAKIQSELMCLAKKVGALKAKPNAEN